MKKRVLSIFLFLAMLFVQTIGVLPAKAAESDFRVDVVVESYDKILAQGSSSKNDVLEAAKEVMDNSGVTYKEETSSWGAKYISTINGVTSKKFSAGDGWLYAVNRDGVYVDTYAADFSLKSGDRIVFYYGIWGTLANKVEYSTTKPNTKLTISISNFDSYSNSATPLNGIMAKIYKSDNSIVFDKVLSENKIDLENGLAEGTYKLEVSDFQTGLDPKVAADNFTFTIKSDSQQDTSTGNTPSNNPYEGDNTKITKDIQSELNSTANYIKSNSVGDAWASLSLKKLGIEPDLTFIRKSAVEVKKSGVQDFTNTDLEKLILVLTANGYKADSFMGYNLISELYNRDINSFLINDAIYGLITYNYANTSGNYKITKDQLVNFILKNKLTYKKDNADMVGWALSGDKLNPDLTGLVISALAPEYKSNIDVKTSVDSAVKSLSLLQNESGYISDSYGYFSESLDMVILGLTSIGVDPEGAEFTKAKGDLVSALLSYKGTDGQFKHSLDGKNDYMATEEALRALIALKEFKANGSYNYYNNNLDSSKLQEFTMTQSELLSYGYLPQTGTVLDFSVLISAGILLMAIGSILILNKRSSLN